MKKQTQKKNNKKRTILLATLIPLGVAAVATAITVPLVLKNKNQDIEIEYGEYGYLKEMDLIAGTTYTFIANNVEEHFEDDPAEDFAFMIGNDSGIESSQNFENPILTYENEQYQSLSSGNTALWGFSGTSSTEPLKGSVKVTIKCKTTCKNVTVMMFSGSM